MSASVGIDVGGTFTDLASVGADGRVEARKVLSTPSDQSVGVAASLAALGASGRSVARVAHGTTVVTNLLLERRGARVALCATAGASDLLELRRQDRASLYDLSADHPPPLVPPERVVAVHERRDPRGVTLALTAHEAERVADEIAEIAPEIVVVSLLHAYDDDAHERLLAEAIARRLPGVDVVCGAAVLPEIREYERTATAVAEGYARPRVATYLDHLSRRLAGGGYPAPEVMTSGGGMRTAAEAAVSAASLALSGPAGGVVGAAAVLRAASLDRALTIDIGGTSADAGLILDGEPLVEPGGAVAGVPIALPRVLVETVSAGGGSIAWVDDGGALRVGPRSAGAVPGPVAFGRGGTQPTVTDAHIVLGNLDATRLSGGVQLDVEGARRAVAALADTLGASPERTAEAIVLIADAEMARALRRVSVERGIDPRSCALVAFGGGGPLHACALAGLLGMRTILVPPHAGVLSALGLAIAPERRDAAVSVMRPAAEIDAAWFAHALPALADRAVGSRAAVRHTWHARVRYAGQGHELDVPCAPSDDGAELAARFTHVHRARYGFTLERPVEVVALRVAAMGEPVRVDFSAPLPAESTFTGPRVVTLADATMVVAAGWSARALPIGGWLLERA
ncbi:MAG: hydantoinase/oxoprolinase family protein [Gemmatimonadetes bacterium]|nr:hydantoinase/oxoprolinase family protein [Gemmatimonadota bacterium]